MRTSSMPQHVPFLRETLPASLYWTSGVLRNARSHGCRYPSSTLTGRRASVEEAGADTPGAVV